MLKTILIEDEPLAMARLRRLLGKHNDTFNIISEAGNGFEGIEQIESLTPDVIFLDIEMPGMTGFEMLAQLSYMPLVIFVTAFDQYAIRAFEEKSVDYLLKPVEEERLEKTIDKLNSFRKEPVKNPFNQNILELLEQFKPKKEIHTLSVKSGERVLFISLTEICYFEAEDKYVFLVTTDGQKYLTSYTLSVLEEKLPDNFMRVSRSFVVNTLLIKELKKYFNGKYLVSMNDKKQTQIETGSTYSDNINKLMKI